LHPGEQRAAAKRTTLAGHCTQTILELLIYADVKKNPDLVHSTPFVSIFRSTPSMLTDIVKQHQASQAVAKKESGA
jgi:hypothetical protein